MTFNKVAGKFSTVTYDNSAWKLFLNFWSPQKSISYFWIHICHTIFCCTFCLGFKIKGFFYPGKYLALIDLFRLYTAREDNVFLKSGKTKTYQNVHFTIGFLCANFHKLYKTLQIRRYLVGAKC